MPMIHRGFPRQAYWPAVDAVGLAMDSLSGITSLPNLGSIVCALKGSERDTGFNPAMIRQFSNYWEDLRSGASEV